MDSSAIRVQLQQVLRKHLRAVAADETIPMEEQLVDLGLDSIATIHLLLDLETAFGVSFPGSMLTPETFRSGASLQQAVSSLVGARA
jgi:acyl carrier protein